MFSSPTSDDMPHTQKARQLPDESSGAVAFSGGTASKTTTKRFHLPQPAVDLREGTHITPRVRHICLSTSLTHELAALYANGRQPSESEKWNAYERILRIEGCDKYSRKVHSNYCTSIERQRKDDIRGKSTLSRHRTRIVRRFHPMTAAPSRRVHQAMATTGG